MVTSLINLTFFSIYRYEQVIFSEEYKLRVCKNPKRDHREQNLGEKQNKKRKILLNVEKEDISTKECNKKVEIESYNSLEDDKSICSEVRDIKNYDSKEIDIDTLWKMYVNQQQQIDELKKTSSENQRKIEKLEKTRNQQRQIDELIKTSSDNQRKIEELENYNKLSQFSDYIC